MNRIDGRVWFDPGIPSMCVPYHDTNDYYFSGHLGSSTMWIAESYARKSKYFQYYCMAVFVIMWLFMTTMRIHYVLDLISGVIIGHFIFLHADWISFFMDVKVLGLPADKRFQNNHKACRKCGWSN